MFESVYLNDSYVHKNAIMVKLIANVSIDRHLILSWGCRNTSTILISMGSYNGPMVLCIEWCSLPLFPFLRTLNDSMFNMTSIAIEFYSIVIIINGILYELNINKRCGCNRVNIAFEKEMYIDKS